jgi:6-phosphogluconolactonase
MMDCTVNYKIIPNVHELAEYFAGFFINRCNTILKEKENMFIALSGGRTPKFYLERLSEERFAREVPWQRIHFFWVDERMVPPSDYGSNYRMIKEVLLDKITIPEENIHRIKGEIVPQLEVRRYGNEVVNNVGKKRNSQPEFDWVLLGMGSDGHTASIFPEVELKDIYQNITAISKSPDSGQMRITLTEDIINNADNITFILSGSDKAEKVYEIIKGEKEKYPAGRINPPFGTLEFIMDKEAAALL